MTIKTKSLSMYADRTMPNTGGWQDRHDAAIREPLGFSMEESIVKMLKAWELYAGVHMARYGSSVGNDGVLGEQWEALGDAIRALLDGETGRLDCGTIDGFILSTMRFHGIDVDIK